MKILSFIIGMATGIISGFGVGGGTILVLYLTAISDVTQYTAGGINLLYFIGCAPAALIGHLRNRMVDIKTALWCGIAGITTVIPTAMLAMNLDTNILRRLFGCLLICVGIKEWKTAKQLKRN